MIPQQFESFNNKTLPSNSFRGDDGPSVTLTRQGLVRFNQAATRFLKLKKDTLIGFRRDPKHKDWYIVIGDPDGFPIRTNVERRASGKVYPQYQFGHKEICRLIREDIQKQGTVTLPLDKTETAGQYALATRQAITRPAKKYTPRQAK